MVKPKKNQWSLLAIVIFCLIMFYQVDQLSNAFFQGLGVISPFKIAISLSPLLFFKYRLIANVKSRWPIQIMWGLVFLSFLSCFWANDILAAVNYTFQILVLLSFLVATLFCLSNIPEIEKKLFFTITLFGGFVALLSILGVFTPKDSINARLAFDGIGTNAVAISSGYILINSISLLFFPKLKLFEKIIAVVAIVLLSLMVLKTGTRSVIWGVFISLSLAYFLAMRNLSFRNFLLLVFTLVVFYIGFNFVVSTDYLQDKVTSRLLDTREETFTENSRINRWEKGLEWYSDNLQGTGAGVANEANMYMSEISHYTEAHSVFVSTLIQLNIMGLLLLISFLGLIGYYVLKIKSNHIKFSAIILLIFFLLQASKGSTLQTRLFWHPVTVILLLVEIDRRRQLKNMEFKKVG